MPKHSRRELSPPLPKAGMIGAAVECLHAVLHEVTLQQQALRAAITMQVRDSCAAGSTRMYTFLETSRRYLRYVLVFYVLLMAALVVLVADLSGCLVTSVATAAGIRHLVLANVPGTAVIPLHFNALPFHDDDWMRHLPEDTALRDFILPDRETHELIQSRTQRVDSLSLLHQHIEQFADAKFSLLSHFVNSHLASTTMYIPRTAASAQVFSPRGGVNLESLFQLGPAMFNAKGEYTAKLQVVLAKEEVGRVVSLILESAMLFSEDAIAVQSVAQLDVLFTKSTSVTVRTGPLQRSWLVLLLEKVLRFWFCLPVWSYEYLVSALRQQDSAPFPPIDSSREVAVVLEVYHRFTPPLDLQPRLRAMNFTLYQLPDAGAPSRVKVSRLIFFSTVQLTGVARWLTDYPVSTFLLLVAILFAASAVASVGSLLGLLAYAYWRWFREQPPELFDEDDSDDEFFAPPRAMPTTVVKNMAPPRLRRHLSSNELYDTLDTSQLRRSQSFNYSPAKEEE
ncbi:conserved hypothetical protein [Leishmania major strain Friedlin]|uniref:Seipin n=1 Tax=Leishmania major TaxID=5664 RepID=Q4Q6P7_LEIMA|nr:conserved hypothetical protein [Leishmania major strain Friedlin]CAG9579166.1 hypothetical_protein_-_conserved [Leishmania major strain Friedlin]CAJ08194.1 conserved hypothetical protein [Leishmania major strain Friedlin]|eukprot:XP_001685001.1 conserved hypothetical protein [Leishmania major strain Friedlin]